MASAWRITKTKFASNPLSAEGARRYGGRWNSPGVSVVYFAESISLAVLEVLVRVQATRVIDAYSLVRIDFESSLVQSMVASAVPLTWADFPAPGELQALGDAWVESSKSALLRVPSATVPLEHILLLDPEHPDCAQLSVSQPIPFRLDPRLLT
jgi:RES domain-containing protein